MAHTMELFKIAIKNMMRIGDLVLSKVEQFSTQTMQKYLYSIVLNRMLQDITRLEEYSLRFNDIGAL